MVKNERNRSRDVVAIAAVPHSWSLSDWPCGVFPGSASRARYLVRCHGRELVAAGALVRIGRSLVLRGAAFDRWLARKGHEVPGFDIAPNAGGCKA